MNEPTNKKLQKPALAIIVALGLAGVSAAGLGYVVSQWQLAEQGTVRPLAMRGEWIEAVGDIPAYSASFRRNFFLPGEVKHAWIAVAACDAFEVLVNGNPVGRHYLWRPTRPFQTGLSEKGQRFTPPPAMAMNFPREYQWADTGTARIPVFIDLTRHLRPGKNTICLELESRRAPAMVRLDGAITLHTGEILPIKSDISWRGEIVPPGLSKLHWTKPAYDDKKWRHAKLATPPVKNQWSTFAPEVFTTPFVGHWLRHGEANSQQAVYFGQTWQLAERPSKAWLRLVVNRPSDVFINGVRVRTNAPTVNPEDTGQWVIGTHRGQDPIAMPELLDPDEVGSIFVGGRFESPRGSSAIDAEIIDFATPAGFSQSFQEDVADAIENEKQRSSEGWKPSIERQHTAFPDRLHPKSLSRNFAVGAYTAYDISRLLRAGENTIAVRLTEPTRLDAPRWTPRLAVDGGAVLESGELLPFASGQGWSTWLQPNKETLLTKIPAISTGPAAKLGNRLPKLQFAGVASNPNESSTIVLNMMRYTTTGLVAAILTIALLVSIRMILPTRNGTNKPSIAATSAKVSRWICGVLLPPLCILFAALLVRCAWAERDDILWFMLPVAWRATLATALIAAWVTALVTTLSRAGSKTSARLTSSTARFFERAPHTILWRFSIIWLLLLGGWLRANAIDFQPLDDDEYASTQAILAIANTGVPSFVPEGILYTRSPLYHYMMGGVVALFGENILSLRLPSVLFSMATAWLAYLFGSRLLGRPWVGLGALLLLSIHPFEVFTGHVARFYQVQQFFALLTMYWFCKGFVSEQSQKYRYLTIGAFLASVLCQEISAVMGFPLALGYLLFAKDKGGRANLKLVAVAALALSVILLDYLVFQTRCLTRVEGVSPSLEATVKPHFWQPYNFFALYIGYSRLHIVLSCFLLLGLPIIWKERHRPTLALNFMLVAGVILINLLVTHVSLRYQYWLIPLWILLSLDALRALVERISRFAFDPKSDLGRNTWIPACCGTIFIAAVVLSWSPWKMHGSYETKILGDSTGAMQYVRHHKLPGDKIMATEPHSHAGFLEIGQIDYDLSVPLLYDFAVLRDGKLIDRNGGAEMISNLHQLMAVCKEQPRVWIMINREKFRTRGKNIRWQYPGARIELFLRQNCQLTHRSYLWSTYLWDANRGNLQNFRADGI